MKYDGKTAINDINLKTYTYPDNYNWKQLNSNDRQSLVVCVVFSR